MEVIGNRYRYWRSSSKNCEPEIVTVEPWPDAYNEPTFGSDWILLRLEKPGAGDYEAIQMEHFLRKQHQKLRAVR